MKTLLGYVLESNNCNGFLKNGPCIWSGESGQSGKYTPFILFEFFYNKHFDNFKEIKIYKTLQAAINRAITLWSSINFDDCEIYKIYSDYTIDKTPVISNQEINSKALELQRQKINKIRKGE